MYQRWTNGPPPFKWWASLYGKNKTKTKKEPTTTTATAATATAPEDRGPTGKMPCMPDYQTSPVSGGVAEYQRGGGIGV